MPVEWGAINTALLLALGGYLWRQARRVDTIYQALFGVNGRNGMLRRLDIIEALLGTVDKRIEDTRHILRNEFQVALLQQHDEIDKRLTREHPGRGSP